MKPFAALLLIALAGAAPKASTGKLEFEQAMRFYDAQEYDAALPYFKKAYELSGRRASAIRALAQCERALKMYDESVAHFREYLAVKPRPADATAVEETIRLIQELQAKAAAAEKPAPVEVKPAPPIQTEVVQETPPPQPAPDLTPKTQAAVEHDTDLTPWFITGGGAALAIAGGVLFAMGQSDISTVEGAPKMTMFSAVADANDRAPLLTGTGSALMGVGAAAIALGVYWLVTDHGG